MTRLLGLPLVELALIRSGFSSSQLETADSLRMAAARYSLAAKVRAMKAAKGATAKSKKQTKAKPVKARKGGAA